MVRALQSTRLAHCMRRRIAGGSDLFEPDYLCGLIARLERSEQVLRERVDWRAAMLDPSTGATTRERNNSGLCFCCEAQAGQQCAHGG